MKFFTFLFLSLTSPVWAGDAYPLDKDFRGSLKSGKYGILLTSRVEKKDGVYVYTYRIQNTHPKKTLLVNWEVPNLAVGFFENEHLWNIPPEKEVVITVKDKEAPDWSSGVLNIFERENHEDFLEKVKDGTVRVEGGEPAWHFLMAASQPGPLQPSRFPRK